VLRGSSSIWPPFCGYVEMRKFGGIPDALPSRALAALQSVCEQIAEIVVNLVSGLFVNRFPNTEFCCNMWSDGESLAGLTYDCPMAIIESHAGS
jgi:hypothetical protein